MLKNNKAGFFYVLYSGRTCTFYQSEHALGRIYIIMPFILLLLPLILHFLVCHLVILFGNQQENSCQLT